MNRIDKTFLELKKKKKKAFIVYLTVGFPNVATTEKLILALAEAGVDMFELGMPFSDPLADGPIIQESSAYALKNKVTLNTVLSLTQRLRKRTGKPLILMGYFNQIFRFGVERFATAAQKSGLDAVIVPDLPIEESGDLAKQLKRNNIHNINFIAPTTDLSRTKAIARISKGFIYYVSLTGTTGARNKLPVEIAKKVRQLKKYVKIPVCVGFGISKKEHFRYVASFSDGAIIGSAIISTIKKNLHSKNLISTVTKFVKSISP